jgi:5-methylcytosine-specific restriction endonuclease McrA
MPRDPENLRAWKQANRARINAQQRAYAARHPDRINATHEKYYQANKDEICAEKRAKRQEDPEAARAYGREYYARKPEKGRERSKRHYWRHRDTLLPKLRAKKLHLTDKARAHARKQSRRQRLLYPEKVNARIAAWSKAHPEHERLTTQRRRARKQSAPRNDVTLQQQLAVIAAAHGVCPYCAVYDPGCQACRKGTHKLTIDHITPLVHGGSHTLHNLIACCRRCNAKKHTGKPPVPVQPLLL